MEDKMLQTDVLIVGGGAAGIGAAIAAARNGSRVILLEKSSQAGGKATAAVVGTVCGAHYRSANPISRLVTTGFASEFCNALSLKSGTEVIHHYQGDLHFLPYHPFAFSLVADQMLQKEPNIQVFFHATLSHIKVSQKRITAIEFLNHQQKFGIQPDQVVDCSGEAVVSALAGLPTYSQDKYQASAIVFSLENIETDNPVQLSLSIIRAVKKAIEEKELDPELARVSIVPGSVRANSLFIKAALPYPIQDELSNKSKLENLGRKAVHEISKQLIKRVSYFNKGHVGMVAPEVGTRTGRLSIGKYQLQKEDVLGCSRFSDGVAKGAWPIEEWLAGQGVQLQFFPLEEHYEIPMRALVSNQLENLYFAGRIISATHEAIASARVIGTCLSTGFAAGTAASFLAQRGSLDQAIRKIREEQVFC